MIVGYDDAVVFFDRFDDFLKAPSFHPYYIITDAKRNGERKPVFFVYEDDEGIFYHGFHVAPIKDSTYYDVQSPYGYGGPLASTDKPNFLKKAWSAYSLWCMENNILAEFIRFHPLAENWRYYNGAVILDRQTVWIDVQCDDLLMSYDVRSRTAVKKAHKDGLILEWAQGAELADLFELLYCEAMTRVNAEQSYYFKHEYFKSLLEWERSRLAICKKDNNIVAMGIFLTGNRVMEYHLSASTIVGRRHAATNLIIHEAALLAQQQGYVKLHLGGGTDSQADNSLFFFKSGFSSHRAVFNIGKQIHNAGAYKNLHDDWQERNGMVPDKVLFYRF
jgi:hypothetical protein